jgi:hypothetical protein
MPSPRTHRLTPLTDLAPQLGDLHLIGVEVGPQQELLALALAGPPDYREERGGASFARPITPLPHDFVVLTHHQGWCQRTTIPGEHWNFHFVQPLPGDELLLVCARCHWAPKGKHDRNARVYGPDGRLVREFLLGDGIQRVQTTADGRIWTSYFDEGVFGNFGWRDPVGASGLVCWDGHGRRLYEYRPPPGADAICDCYALNVPSDEEVWFYYYTDFPLVRLRRDSTATVWPCPVRGADAFAVAGPHVLFRGGYDRHDRYHLFEVPNRGGEMTPRGTFTFTDAQGDGPVGASALGRGPFLYLFQGTLCYRVDVRELL